MCKSSFIRPCLSLFALGALALGCGSAVQSSEGDAGFAADAGADSGTAAPLDAGSDAGADAGSDAGFDGGASAGRLPGFNLDGGENAVAGISSGGFMAVQLHVAFSSTFQRGAAVFAGGPYDCAQGSLALAEDSCGQVAVPIDLTALEAITDANAVDGGIDPTANLAGAPVWLWSGALDTIVLQPVMNALHDYYQHYGASLVYESTTLAGHAWISPDGPNLCAVEATPFINHCGVDVEATFLAQLFGSLQPKRVGILSGNVIQFSQDEFFDDHNANAHSLDRVGFLYVPASCQSGAGCRLLVALHGCDQSASQVGESFIHDSGLNAWADTNQLLVLYPQTIISPLNPQGCWDWWGYDDVNYTKKSGHQMAAIKRMVDRLNGI